MNEYIKHMTKIAETYGIENFCREAKLKPSARKPFFSILFKGYPEEAITMLALSLVASMEQKPKD